MSWIERITADMTITTGDGKVYTPHYLVATKAKEFNTSQFEFNEVPGSLVVRKMPKGRIYAIEIIFQGDDHLDVSDAFDESSNHPKAWGISHPIYGGIIVQPSSLQWDNSVISFTRITGTIIETISDEEITFTVSAPNKITEDKLSTDAAHASAFATNIPSKKISVLNQLKSDIDNTYKIISQKISDTTDTTEFTNKYNEVVSLINGTVYNANHLISSVQELISRPARFAATIMERIAMLQALFSSIGAGISPTQTKDIKRVYESVGGAVISTVVLTSVTNIGTAYINKNDVLTVVSSIHDLYTTHIERLNTLQTSTGGTPTSYTPDPGALIWLTNLVGYAISALFDIAKDSRQERAMILERDSNVIMLAHRFYGLKADDSTIREFVESNNIGINELLQVRKGRRLVYYV